MGNYKPRRWTFVYGVCGFIIAAALYFILTSKLDGFFNDTTRYTVLILTCLLTFVSTSILLYAFFYTQQTQSMLSRLQVSYAHLLQAASLAEELYNQQLPGLDEPFKQQIDEGQTRYKVSIAQIDQAYQRQLTESQTRYNKSKQQLEQTLQQQVKELRLDVETFIQEADLSGAAFTEATVEKMAASYTDFLPNSSRHSNLEVSTGQPTSSTPLRLLSRRREYSLQGYRCSQEYSYRSHSSIHVPPISYPAPWHGPFHPH